MMITREANMNDNIMPQSIWIVQLLDGGPDMELNRETFKGRRGWVFFKKKCLQFQHIISIFMTLAKLHFWNFTVVRYSWNLTKISRTFLSCFSHEILFFKELNKYISVKICLIMNCDLPLSVSTYKNQTLLPEFVTVQKNYRLHDEEACSTEDDDDHDEKRVVAGQACPMALRGILLHHLPVLKKRVESEPREVFSLQ